MNDKKHQEKGQEPEIVPDDETLPEDLELESDDDDPKKERHLPALKGSGSLARVDPFTAYINEIRQYEEISEEEEHRLAVKFLEDGDLDAAYRLVTHNLTLVVKIAMTFKREWETLMDLVQEGNVGLMKAVQNFDPFRGVRLPAYASWWVKAYILKYLLDNWRLVRVGTTNTRRKLLYNLKKEKEKLEKQGFVPTTKLLAEHFGVDESEVIDVQASLGAADVSMDAPLKRGETDWTPNQFLTTGEHPEDHVEDKQFKEVLREHISEFLVDLKPVEKELFEERILTDSPKSLQEIGENYGVTREAIRQTEQRLMKKLKTYLEENMPDVADYFKN